MDPRSPVDRRAFVCGATVGVAGLALGRPLSAEQRRMIDDAIPRMNEATTKKSLPAGQFGLGYGAAAHAPDEFWLVESTNPNVAGMDGSVRSFVGLFYSLA